MALLGMAIMGGSCERIRIRDMFSYQEQLVKEETEKKRRKKFDKEKRLAEALGKIETKYGPGKIRKGTSS